MGALRWTSRVLGWTVGTLLVAELGFQTILAYRRWLWKESRRRFETSP